MLSSKFLFTALFVWPIQDNVLLPRALVVARPIEGNALNLVDYPMSSMSMEKKKRWVKSNTLFLPKIFAELKRRKPWPKSALTVSKWKADLKLLNMLRRRQKVIRKNSRVSK